MPRVRATVKLPGGLFAFTERHPDADPGICRLLTVLEEGIAETETLLAFTEDGTGDLLAALAG